ncbi:uncharacterized protein LOC121410882 isoform X1 [Lytechinus variegatus]|uniref:uncharacterized protein LOC121410882 isoform X1 n=1 Tax=Lytechinus variegatus TaxID=7654 RepID=UPI001BB15C45|nr:uncharacterized protein LOC121410882 isoform X1 [Lytechinus variegatus]
MFMMKYVALITIVCLLPAIVAVSVDNNNENKNDLHRIVEKTVPSSYKNAYNILMKANEIKTRSDNTNEGQDYPQIPPIDPQVRLEVSEILAKTIEDINDRLYSLAENIKVLSQNQLLFNARLSAIEDANEIAIVPVVEGIHNHHQQTDQGNQHGDDRNGNDMEGNLSLINELVDVAVDRIEDAQYIVAESGESHDESPQATSMPPHTTTSVNGDQQQLTSTIQPHTSTSANGDHQQEASTVQPHTTTSANSDHQQEASTVQPHTTTSANSDHEQQASTSQPHTSTSVNGDHQQEASTVQPHPATNVNGDHQQEASTLPQHNTSVKGDQKQDATAMPPHTPTNANSDQQQHVTTMPSHTSTNVNGDQQQQPTAMPPHANVVTTTAQSHANTEQETSALPPQSNGDSQQSTTMTINRANGVEVLDEKRNYLGDHRRYSFRGYNPFIGDRRSSVLSRLRNGLPLRQVSYQVPVKLRKGARLDQTWYPKEFQHRN